MKTDTLKQQAREHELSEEWEKALSLYRKAVEALDEAQEPDIALLNRMADLQVRTGDLDGAIQSYEEAIDLYLESDLPNNAIAICRKMIRNAPGRPEIFRRMGEIRARQGFVVDARQSYLTYAEMIEARGDRDQALEGLEELVTLIPDDAETRVFLGEQLVAVEREEEGVSHLLHAWKVLKRDGDEERSEELAGRIRGVDPAAIFPELDDPAEEASPDDPFEGALGFEATGLGEPALDEDETIDVSPPEGLSDDFGGDLTDEISDDFDDDFGGEIELPADDEPEGEVEVEMPVSGLETSDTEVDFGSVDLDDPPLADDDAIDESGIDDDAVPESDEPLPLLGMDDPFDFDGLGESPVSEGIRTAEDIRAGIADDPDDPDRHEELVELAYRTNDRDLLLTAFVGLAGALARSGSSEKATAVYEQVLQLDPSHPVALEALGRSMEPAGPPEVPGETEGTDMAEDAFGEVAGDWTPGDEDPDPEPFEVEIEEFSEPDPATSIPEEESPLVEASSEVPADEPEPVSDEGDYVDLGAMIFEGDDEVGTTRWVAPGHEPSGDEGMDFASMLSDFKEKVARNLDHEDSSSRYDLGAAYKEMGLLDEAISMFQAALRARPSHLGAIEMMGQCFLDKDEPGMAARVLTRALDLPRPIEDDLLGIYYYLGEAHERAGNPDEAREFYEKVFSLDINFKDVTQRLRDLR